MVTLDSLLLHPQFIGFPLPTTVPFNWVKFLSHLFCVLGLLLGTRSVVWFVPDLIWLTGYQRSCPVLPLPSAFVCWACNWNHSRLRTRLDPDQPRKDSVYPSHSLWVHFVWQLYMFLGYTCWCRGNFRLTAVGMVSGSTTVACPEKKAPWASCPLWIYSHGHHLWCCLSMSKNNTVLSRNLAGSRWKCKWTVQSAITLKKKSLCLYSCKLQDVNSFCACQARG